MSNTAIRGASSINDAEFLTAYNDASLTNAQMMEKLSTDWTAVGVKLRSERVRLHTTVTRTGGAKGEHAAKAVKDLAVEALIWQKDGTVQVNPKSGVYVPMNSATASAQQPATTAQAPAAATAATAGEVTATVITANDLAEVKEKFAEDHTFQIDEVNFEIGDFVDAGAVICSLDVYDDEEDYLESINVTATVAGKITQLGEYGEDKDYNDVLVKITPVAEGEAAATTAAAGASSEMSITMDIYGERFIFTGATMDEVSEKFFHVLREKNFSKAVITNSNGQTIGIKDLRDGGYYRVNKQPVAGAK